MADKEKKEGKTEIQKVEYLENEKSFLDEISIFYNYLRAIIWCKSEKYWAEVLTSRIKTFIILKIGQGLMFKWIFAMIGENSSLNTGKCICKTNDLIISPPI